MPFFRILVATLFIIYFGKTPSAFSQICALPFIAPLNVLVAGNLSLRPMTDNEHKDVRKSSNKHRRLSHDQFLWLNVNREIARERPQLFEDYFQFLYSGKIADYSRDKADELKIYSSFNYSDLSSKEFKNIEREFNQQIDRIRNKHAWAHMHIKPRRYYIATHDLLEIEKEILKNIRFNDRPTLPHEKKEILPKFEFVPGRLLFHPRQFLDIRSLLINDITSDDMHPLVYIMVNSFSPEFAARWIHLLKANEKLRQRKSEAVANFFKEDFLVHAVDFFEKNRHSAENARYNLPAFHDLFDQVFIDNLLANSVLFHEEKIFVIISLIQSLWILFEDLDRDDVPKNDDTQYSPLSADLRTMQNEIKATLITVRANGTFTHEQGLQLLFILRSFWDYHSIRTNLLRVWLLEVQQLLNQKLQEVESSTRPPDNNLVVLDFPPPQQSSRLVMK